jgi:recombination protein RecT
MNAVAERRPPAPIEVLKGTVARRADDFKMVLPSHITVDKFQRTIATAALSNPQLLNCDRQSLLIAAMKLAQDGLLPDGREAALVPFKTWDKDTRQDKWLVQPMPMAWGVRKKILQSGQVVSLETGVVYRAEMEGGNFIFEVGMDPPIRHRPKLDMTDDDMADENIVAAYSIARIKNENGSPYWSVEVMRRSEINKVRQASQTGAVGRVVKGGPNKGKPIEPKGPWVDWFGEMARKTVLRRHSKVLPMSSDLLDSFERDDAEDARARGAAMLLEEREEKPLVMPSADQLADQSGTEAGVAIDLETGEVLQEAAGLTEVDQETAQQLDSQTYAEMEGGRADHEHGDQHDGSGQPDQVADFLERIEAAKTKTALSALDKEFERIGGGLSDGAYEKLDQALAAAAKRINRKED